MTHWLQIERCLWWCFGLTWAGFSWERWNFCYFLFQHMPERIHQHLNQPLTTVMRLSAHLYCYQYHLTQIKPYQINYMSLWVQLINTKGSPFFLFFKHWLWLWIFYREYLKYETKFGVAPVLLRTARKASFKLNLYFENITQYAKVLYVCKEVWSPSIKQN